mgnify:CR=1 FL=1
MIRLAIPDRVKTRRLPPKREDAKNTVMATHSWETDMPVSKNGSKLSISIFVLWCVCAESAAHTPLLGISLFVCCAFHRIQPFAITRLRKKKRQSSMFGLGVFI